MAEPRAPIVKIENTAARSAGVSRTSSAMSGDSPAARRFCDQTKNAWIRKIPHTIMIGAGDISKILNGAPGPANSTPQTVRLLAPKLIRNTAAAARITPTLSILALDRPLTGLSLLLSR